MWLRIAYCFPKVGFIPKPLMLLHLDNMDPALMRQRYEAKRGAEVRELITRHLKLAEERESLREFEPLARSFLCKTLLSAVYRGFKADARVTARQFRDLVPWYWRSATYVLTIFPKATAATARAIMYIADRLRTQGQVTRRWSYGKNGEKAD
jgi:hypothetical protein